jgi:hypothetical protein
MPDAVAELRERASHVAGASGHVHDRVELLALEPGQTARAVAVDPDESHALRDGAGDPTGSACDVVAHVDRVTGDGATEVHGAAEDQEPHAVSRTVRRAPAAHMLVDGI